MRVPDCILERSFKYAGITREALHTALRTMLPAALKANDLATTLAMRREWTEQNPTRFTCYFVSEVVYWYLSPKGSSPMALEVDGDTTLHRYVRWPDGENIDLTCDQFADYGKVDYYYARPRMFMQTGGVGPSKRAQHLAALLKLEEWKR